MALAGCSIVGIRGGTPTPAYTVIGHAGPVEIRQYGPRLAASTVVQGDQIAARSAGFRRLAGYIFGANTKAVSIAMTAPVVQSGTGSSKIAMTAPVVQTGNAEAGWTITFYMPPNYSLATIPRPTQPGIEIHEIAAATDAVYRFSGSIGAAAIGNARKMLFAQLAGSAWEITGEPVSWFYDPPWTLPWFRRNEVAVAVAPRQP